MRYDGQIAIAVANTRKSTNWKNTNLLWSEFVKRLEVTTRTPESQAEYTAMAKAKRDEIKDVGGFVGGILKNGRRKTENVGPRRLLTLDLDAIGRDDDPWSVVTMVLGCAAVVYSTHSHMQNAKRLRIIMPLSRPVNADEYLALSHLIASDIGIDMCDDSTYEPHRLMYWPSTSFDAEYLYDYQDAPWLNVDSQLNRYNNWNDPSEWPVSSRKASVMKRLAAKQGDPLQKSGVVGAFCRTYSIEDAIEQFLPEVYQKYDDGRYTFLGGSTSGGLVLYENGKFAYSHHGSDPAGGRLCNAFDLVRLHMFADADDEATAGTPVNRLPSFTKMSELAIGDEAVRQNLIEQKMQDVVSSLDDEENVDWMKKLSFDDKGRLASTIDNAFLITLNDPDIKDKYYYDVFREKPIVCGDLPWQMFSERMSFVWSDSDDAGLRNLLEKRYGISNINKIKDAIELAMLQRVKHPVKEYLENLEWDGIQRAEELFIYYLGANDTSYVREVTKKALLGAVARIYSPGCKHDHMLVLVGPQGCLKSTTLVKLGKTWFSDSLYTLSGKDAYEQLQGYWILELSEMAATRKAEIEQIKQFISKQEDNYRAAYARRAQSHPRQCAFFGTTNDDDFLRDPTGGRRFWPVRVTDIGRRLGRRLDDSTVDQIWAEIVVRYKAGETWYLSDSMEAEAREVQQLHTESNGKLGLVENFVSRKIPADWDDWTYDRRMLFWSDSFNEGLILVSRTKICAIELWQELFKGDVKAYTPTIAREMTGLLKQLKGWEYSPYIHSGVPYGKQRGFIFADSQNSQ